MSAYQERKLKECNRRAVQLSSGEVAIKHGTLSGYNNYKCRCESCRGAYSVWYSLYAASKRPAPARKLNGVRAQVSAEQESDELKQLIQEQHNDDLQTRLQYGTSINGKFNDVEDFEARYMATCEPDFASDLIGAISFWEEETTVPFAKWCEDLDVLLQEMPIQKKPKKYQDPLPKRGLKEQNVTRRLQTGWRYED